MLERHLRDLEIHREHDPLHRQMVPRRRHSPETCAVEVRRPVMTQSSDSTLSVFDPESKIMERHEKQSTSLAISLSWLSKRGTQDFCYRFAEYHNSRVPEHAKMHARKTLIGPGDIRRTLLLLCFALLFYSILLCPISMPSRMQFFFMMSPAYHGFTYWSI